MKRRKILCCLLLAILILSLSGCKKDPAQAERAAMEEQYDVNGADPYRIRNPGGFKVWIYEKIARRVTEDGWVFTFEQYGSKTGDDSNLCRYSFSGVNLRYRYDDAYIQTVSHSTDSGVIRRERQIPATLNWGCGPSAQQRDRELIETILTNDREPEALLALDPADYRFESIDKELFFGLMREALTGDRHKEGTNRAYWEIQESAFLTEPLALDGYKLQIAYLAPLGCVDEIYIDVLYPTGEGYKDYVQLSDLVEQGEASPEQREAFALLAQIGEKIKREDSFIAGAEEYRNRKLGGVDFSRLARFLQKLHENDIDAYRVEDIYEEIKEGDSA